MIRTILVDDEPLAREGLKELAVREKDLEIVGECGDGIHAVREIDRLRPDLIFLDVQMPACDGFEVLRRLSLRPIPRVIIVTAFDEFAVKAFDVHAIDYLLKPIDPARFRASVHRVRCQPPHNQEQLAASMTELIALLDARRPAPRKFLIRSSNRISLLDVDAIDWIEAHGEYVWIHAGGKKSLMRETISNLTRTLSGKGFARIHRSTIVRIDRVKELQPMFSGDYAVHLDTGTTLTMSRSYRGKLFAMLAAGQ